MVDVLGPSGGWHPDPLKRGGLRWHDGQRWTDHAALPDGPGELEPQEAEPSVALPGPAVATLWAIGPFVAVWLSIWALGALLGETAGFAVAIFVVEPIALLAMPLRWARKHGMTLTELVALRFGRPDIARGIGMGVVIQLVSLPIVALLLLFSEELYGSNVGIGDEGSVTVLRILVVVGALVIAAPLLEEIIFRGIVLPSYSAAFGDREGLFGSSALFGSFHIVPVLGLGNVGLVVAITTMGIVLAWESRQTGRLGSPIIAHATANAIVVLAWLAA